MAYTFLRFQEHYESPRFMNRVFTHEEYKKWYIKLKGKFSYYKDWDGFNIPSSALRKFYDGNFDPLTAEEKAFLNLFKNHKHKFYIIAVFGKNPRALLRHEIAHGLFFSDVSYRRKVLRIMKEYDLSKVKKELLNLGGYSKKVLLDEIQAYTVSLSNELRSKISEEMSRKIKELYYKYVDE